MEFCSLHLNLGLQNHSNSGIIANQMHDFVSDMVSVLLMVLLLMLEDWTPRDTIKAHKQTPPWLYVTPSPELEDGSSSLNSRLPILTLFHFFPSLEATHSIKDSTGARVGFRWHVQLCFYDILVLDDTYCIFIHTDSDIEKNIGKYDIRQSVFTSTYFLFNVFWESDLQSDTHWRVAKYSLVSLRQCQAYVR